MGDKKPEEDVSKDIVSKITDPPKKATKSDDKNKHSKSDDKNPNSKSDDKNQKSTKTEDVSALVQKYTNRHAKALQDELQASHKSLSDDLKGQFNELKDMVQGLVGTDQRHHVRNNAQSSAMVIDDQSSEEEDLSNDEKFEDKSSTDEEETLTEGLESKTIKSRVVPDDESVRIWAKARKVTDDYDIEDWKKSVKLPIVPKYTSHPSARSFKAPAADSEFPPLKYKEQKEFEKKVGSYNQYHLYKDVVLSG